MRITWLVVVVVVVVAVACERTATEPVPSPPPSPVPTPVDAPSVDAPGPHKITLPEKRPAPKCTAENLHVAPNVDCVAACAKGDGEACATAASQYWGGVGVKADDDKCLEAGIAGCKLGSGSACASVSASYAQRQVDRAKAEQYDRLALPLYERECAAGNAHSCKNAWFWYLDLWSQKEDPAKAKALAARGRELEDRACEARNGAACVDIAVRYAVGDGVLIDETRAQALYVRACEYGYAISCYEAATNTWRGVDQKVVTVDDATRTKLLLEGCALGLGKACTLLPSYEGSADAFAFHQRGCELNDAQGCYLAGGDAKATARQFFQRGCDLGSSNACTSLALLR